MSGGNEVHKVSTYLTITVHDENGNVKEVIKPYELASLTDKMLFWLGLKNLTRSG